MAKYPRLLSILALLGLLSACRRSDAPKPSPSEPESFARGDRVVVELSAAEFFEARVIDVEAAKLRVQHKRDGTSHDVARSDVYRVPPEDDAPTTGFAICRIDARWVGCKIESGTGERRSVRDANDASFELARNDVLAPTSLTELNLRRLFERSKRRAEFERAVAGAGAPRVPAGWRPMPRERVLASDGKGWYAARIREIEDDRLHVEWRADERVTELEKSAVIPEPPYRETPPRGRIVLVRPSVPAGAWVPMRVVASGAEIVVEDASGEQRSVPARDVVPLGAR